MTDIRNRMVEYIPALRRYARSLLRNAQTADDLVQDCLVRAIGSQELFRHDTNLRAWLFSILYNLYVDSVRKSARSGVLISFDDWADMLSSPPTQMDTVYISKLDWALTKLPEDQKSALLLVALEGMSYKEAAAIIGVAVGTVKSRVSRARETLRQLMEELKSQEGRAANSSPKFYLNA